MSSFLRRYGTATTIRIPIVKRSAVDFALGADWTPVAGDVRISRDGGATANITTLPTAVAMGNTAYWSFPLSATEMQAGNIIVTVADAATKVVEDQAFVIDTYGNASALHPFDFGTATVTVGANNDKTGYALTAGERTTLADTLLDRDMSLGTDSGSSSVRTPRQALRALRNRIRLLSGTLTVFKEDDSQTSWTAAATGTSGADPLTEIDPA